MNRGYTQAEAEALVNQVLETHAFVGSVPRGSRGRVIEAIDVGDHWNVLIEWEPPLFAAPAWYDKFDVHHSMRPVPPAATKAIEEEPGETVEIRSSHDLSGPFSDARRTGRHSYRVDYRHFASALRSWRNDKQKRSSSLGLTCLSGERIWITTGESKRLAAAIDAKRSVVTLD